MEEQESTTPLAVEINFLSELLRSNRQQHRAAKHFRLSCALVARVGRLAPPPADNERAAAACDAAAAVALVLGAALGKGAKKKEEPPKPAARAKRGWA